MFSSSSLFSTVFFLLGSVATANTNPLGPGALNNLQFFQFKKTSSFQCQTTGSRCGFDRSEYNQNAIDIGGAFNEQAAGTLWTVESPNDELRLAGCIGENCVAYCFSDCTCVETGTNEPCATTTPLPTAAPVPTPAPQAYDCPQKQSRELCPGIMTNNLPVPDPGCDCYNFCNGAFLSCCNEDTNSCGSTACTGTTVLGCTSADIQAITDEENNNPSPSSFAVAPPTLVGHIAAGLGAAVALGL